MDALRHNHNNVSIYTCRSSSLAHQHGAHNCIQPDYHLQYVALSYLHESMIDTDGHVHMYKSYFGLHCNSCIIVHRMENVKCIENIRLNY